MEIAVREHEKVQKREGLYDQEEVPEANFIVAFEFCQGDSDGAPWNREGLGPKHGVKLFVFVGNKRMVEEVNRGSALFVENGSGGTFEKHLPKPTVLLIALDVGDGRMQWRKALVILPIEVF